MAPDPDPLYVPEEDWKAAFEASLRRPQMVYVPGPSKPRYVVEVSVNLAFLLVALCAAGVGFLIGRIVT